MKLARLLSRSRHVDAPRSSTARSHVGRVRQVNEDRTLDCPDRKLWAVADGMGGHFAGDVAADRAISALRRLADSDTPIDATTVAAALDDANREIQALARSAHGTCGTTIVVAWIIGDTAHVAWSGDSRAYLIRNGSAQQLTADHSLIQEMIAAGALTPELARGHPGANVVTRALGVEETLKLDIAQTDLRSGDRLLLCSDGLSASLESSDFAGRHLAVESEADALLAKALARDGSDNISLVLIDHG